LTGSLARAVSRKEAAGCLPRAVFALLVALLDEHGKHSPRGLQLRRGGEHATTVAQHCDVLRAVQYLIRCRRSGLERLFERRAHVLLDQWQDQTLRKT
jgi:hypothetical protein